MRSYQDVIKRPVVGDVVVKGRRTRTVLRIDGNDITYKTDTGREAGCWITTWSAWASKADRILAKPN